MVSRSKLNMEIKKFDLFMLWSGYLFICALTLLYGCKTIHGKNNVKKALEIPINGKKMP